jgi:hypothetical protein
MYYIREDSGWLERMAEDVNCFVICEQSHLERVAHREQVVPCDSKAMCGALIGDALDDVVGYACTL